MVPPAYEYFRAFVMTLSKMDITWGKEELMQIVSGISVRMEISFLFAAIEWTLSKLSINFLRFISD